MLLQDHEKDDFWDIEQLLPPRKDKKERGFASSAPMMGTEIELNAPLSDRASVQDMPLNRPPRTLDEAVPRSKVAPSVPYDTYTPNHPLLRRVSLYRWRSDFRFYERFCSMAARYFDQTGEPCEPVPFFSYMPQYDQMNRAQMSWYLHWRDRVRAGEYPDTDYSYIFLYLFEIINLPGRVPPDKGQALLCRIWRRYRKDYPLLNRYLADWICDYSLIHHLPPPTKELTGLLRHIAEQSSFKEFYATPTGDDSVRDAQIYLLFGTNYDYKKSKLYQKEEARPPMDRHIPGALSAVLRELEAEGQTFASTGMQTATLSRDTFIGALCSADMKQRIEVEYCSFQRSHQLRFLVTDIIKFAENKLRAAFGMKSKLTVYALPDRVKEILNGYFDRELPAKIAVTRPQSTRPDYEANYDVPTSPISAARAAEIEQASWSVTKRLVEAFEEKEEPLENLPPTDVSAAVAQSKTKLLCAFLESAADADLTRQREIAKEAGMLPDAMAERINECATDCLGDILLDADEQGVYFVIEDYQDQVSALKQQLLSQEGGQQNG